MKRQASDRIQDVDGLTDQAFLAPAAEVLELLAEYVADVHRLGARTLANANRVEATSTVILLLAQALRVSAGLPAVIRSGAVFTTIPILPILEAMLGLDYLLEADTERRSSAYRVATLKKKLQLARSFDQSREEGRKTAARFMSDEFTPGQRLPSPEHVQQATQEAESGLSNPELAAAVAEWARTKKDSGRHPHWYSLWDGPRNLEELADRQHAGAVYQVFYREWSRHGHAEGVTDHMRIHEGKGVFKHCFDPTGMEQIAMVGGTLLLHMARRVAELAGKEAIAEVQYRYAAQLRARHLHMANRTSIKTVLGTGKKTLESPPDSSGS